MHIFDMSLQLASKVLICRWYLSPVIHVILTHVQVALLSYMMQPSTELRIFADLNLLLLFRTYQLFYVAADPGQAFVGAPKLLMRRRRFFEPPVELQHWHGTQLTVPCGYIDAPACKACAEPQLIYPNPYETISPHVLLHICQALTPSCWDAGCKRLCVSPAVA